MQDTIDEFLVEPTEMSNKELLIKIWTEPTKTLKYILDKCPTQYVTVFIVLAGITKAIDRASTKGMGDNMSTISLLFFAILGGLLFGWMGTYLYAWGMSATGKWLKGQASSAEFRTVMAWASIPSICSLILLVPELILFGGEIFKSNPTFEYDVLHTVLLGFGIVEMILSLWSLVILIKGIILIQNFNIWKSILNFLLPVLVLLVPIAMIIFIVS